MKKIIASIFSLALIFIFASSANPKPGMNSTIYPWPAAASIYYNITVTMLTDQPLCGAYLIMITDGNGKQVAPVQYYVEGVTNYMFTEVGRNFTGVRTAKMIAAPTKNEPVCDQLLSTEPDSKFTYYVIGQTYPFHLYPKFEFPHN